MQHIEGYKIISDLGANLVPTVIYYHKPLPQYTAFRYLGYKVGSFPIAEDVARNICSHPMHPYLSDEQYKYIVSILKYALELRINFG
ncbi:MAG: DegT/DnrJ/EryC1/StrS family aminotransferase [Atribacterota bacterium]